MLCLALNQTKGSFRVNKLFIFLFFIVAVLFLAYYSILFWDEVGEVTVMRSIAKRSFIFPEPNSVILDLNSERKTDRKTDAEIDNERRTLRTKEKFNLIEEDISDSANKRTQVTDCTIGLYRPTICCE